MNKTIIAPIVAVLAMAVQLLFGVKIDEQVLNELTVVIANAIAVFVTLYGIYTNYKKEDK